MDIAVGSCSLKWARGEAAEGVRQWHPGTPQEQPASQHKAYAMEQKGQWHADKGRLTARRADRGSNMYLRASQTMHSPKAAGPSHVPGTGQCVSLATGFTRIRVAGF